MAREIALKNLKLKNFKGIKDLNIGFSKETNIFGENASGKTTIFDAFTWLLFDKDSKDRTAFDIKTLDNNNNVLHGLEHEVTGVLTIEGKDVILSKIYKEKWTKKRGEANKELTGHETLYYIDEVPVKKGEYQDKISNLINEQLFKLISNPLYFSTNIKWQDRRKVLLDIIGDITTDRIINYRNDLRAIEELLVDKDIDTLKKSIQAKKKRLNDDIKSIPFRIDECNNSISEVDFNALEFRKRGVVTGIKSIEDQLLDSSKVSDEALKEKDKLYKLKSSLKDIEYNAKEEAEKPLATLKSKLGIYKNEINYKIQPDISGLEASIKRNNSLVIDYEKRLANLREEWGVVNQEALEISTNEFICPTCKRPFEDHDIESKQQEMHENFNQTKSNKLSNINARGKKLKEDADRLKLQISEEEQRLAPLYDELESTKKHIEELEYQIFNFEPQLNLATNQEYQDTLKQIQELEDKLQSPVVTAKTLELKAKKMQLESDLEDINKQLAYKQHNENMRSRIAELQEEEKKLAQQIAQLEGQEFLCEEFIKTKVELLESSINSKFKYVSFKLFDIQVNGGLNETCEALVNGVPFSNANTASQINAGLDIINALSEHYGVQTPIFIDNRESVNSLIEINSQVINLIVSKDKSLRVEEI